MSRRCLTTHPLACCYFEDILHSCPFSQFTLTFPHTVAFLSTITSRKYCAQVFLSPPEPLFQVNSPVHTKEFHCTYFLPARQTTFFKSAILRTCRCRRISTRHFPHHAGEARWQCMEHWRQIRCPKRKLLAGIPSRRNDCGCRQVL